MANTTYNLINGYYSWDEVADIALSYPVHTDILVGFDMVPEFPDYFEKIRADKDGQKANYGYSLPDKRGIHIKVYDGYYKVHWDKKSSLTDPLGHLYHDAPHWIAIMAIGLAAVVVGAVVVSKLRK